MKLFTLTFLSLCYQDLFKCIFDDAALSVHMTNYILGIVSK